MVEQSNDPQSMPANYNALEYRLINIVQDGLNDLKQKKAALQAEYNDLHAASCDPQLLATNIKKMQTIAKELKEYEEYDEVLCERMKQAFVGMKQQKLIYDPQHHQRKRTLNELREINLNGKARVSAEHTMYLNETSPDHLLKHGTAVWNKWYQDKAHDSWVTIDFKSVKTTIVGVGFRSAGDEP